MSLQRCSTQPRAWCALPCAMLIAAGLARADQVEIVAPPGSVQFGGAVAVLPNGNFVVTDVRAHAGAGAAHLYRADGTLLSTLTGASPGDHTGFRIVVLADGDFLVASPGWTNPATGASNAGAVTRVDADTGLDGVVTASNSLVGSSEQDFVGLNLLALPGGGWVSHSFNWDNGALEDAGAVTMVPAGSSLVGPVSGFNSLVGTTADDRVGSSGRVVLASGHLVVCSIGWDNGALPDVGAATWIDTSVGISGPVSATNSLVGSSPYDGVGSSSNCATALANGNYVVRSPDWDHDGVVDAGAATWADGDTGRVGEVSPQNSLVGTHTDDRVGSSVVALANGHYVVASPRWDDGTTADVGAVTWADGDAGLVGQVSAGNSLVGSQPQDRVGWSPITPLVNGHYVVGSPVWANGGASAAGAATWRSGDGPAPGVVSAANSLVGRFAEDRVGLGLTALDNGHYVVLSPLWDGDGSAAGENFGAATWGDGSGGSAGIVSAANSLVGSSAGDQVAQSAVALAGGDYLVASERWDNGSTVDAGAVTWADGAATVAAAVSPTNSLIGASANDRVGWRVQGLDDGRVAVSSPYWNGPGSQLGAVSIHDVDGGLSGVVTAANALHGTSNTDYVGLGRLLPLPGGHLAFASEYWDNGAASEAGAVTLLDAALPATGPLDESNSVLGRTELGGGEMVMDYDAERKRLLVGSPYDNRAVFLSLPAVQTEEIFRDGFE